MNAPATSFRWVSIWEAIRVLSADSLNEENAIKALCRRLASGILPFSYDKANVLEKYGDDDWKVIKPEWPFEWHNVFIELQTNPYGESHFYGETCVFDPNWFCGDMRVQFNDGTDANPWLYSVSIYGLKVERCGLTAMLPSSAPFVILPPDDVSPIESRRAGRLPKNHCRAAAAVGFRLAALRAETLAKLTHDAAGAMLGEEYARHSENVGHPDTLKKLGGSILEGVRTIASLNSTPSAPSAP